MATAPRRPIPVVVLQFRDPPLDAHPDGSYIQIAMIINPRGERGEGRFGTFLALLLVLLGIYLGVKCVPVMINAYAFRDFLDEEARYSQMRKSEDEARAR